MGFQNTQDCHWMVAGVELKKYVTGRAGTFIASVLPQDWRMTMLKINRNDVAGIELEQYATDNEMSN